MPVLTDQFARSVVLVVEDEVLIRTLVSEELEDAGFNVVQAEHAAEALTLLQSQAEAIDALFTDVLMPGQMDGVALAHETRRSWPWIHILLASGHLAPAEGDLPNRSRFLCKPYSMQHIVAHLREMIGV